GGKKIETAAPLGNRHGNFFTEFGADRSRAKRAERAPHLLQCRRRIGNGAKHIWRAAKGALDFSKQRFGRSSRGCGINKIHSWHGDSPFVQLVARPATRRFETGMRRFLLSGGAMRSQRRPSGSSLPRLRRSG